MSEDLKSLIEKSNKKLSKEKTEKRIEIYKKTESYHRLIEEIKMKDIRCSEELMVLILDSLADNYIRIVGNEKNVYKNMKYLLEYYPFYVSIYEIAYYDYAEKSIFTIPVASSMVAKKILNGKNIDYEINEIKLYDVKVCIITFTEKFISAEDMRSFECKKLRKIISSEFNNAGILYGLYFLSKETTHIPLFNTASLMGDIELDLSSNHFFAHSGYREDLEKVFRSSWEANVARALSFNHVEFSYEKLPFEEDKYSYLPDFVFPNDCLLEVKGIWDNQSLSSVTCTNAIFQASAKSISFGWF